MAAASTATVLSPLSHSKGGERATSSEWARAGSDTAREGGKEGRAGKRIATSRPSTVCPPLPTATGDRPRPPTLRAAHGPFAFLSFSSLPTCVRVAHTKSAQAAKREQCLYVDLFHSFLLPKHVATMDDERERAFCARMYLLLRVANSVVGGIGRRRQSVRSPVSRQRSCSDDVLLSV